MLSLHGYSDPTSSIFIIPNTYTRHGFLTGQIKEVDIIHLVEQDGLNEFHPMKISGICPNRYLADI